MVMYKHFMGLRLLRSVVELWYDFFYNISIFFNSRNMYGVIFSQLTGVSPLSVPPNLKKSFKIFPTDWCPTSSLSHLTLKTVYPLRTGRDGGGP